MKVLIVAREKVRGYGRKIAPFVIEQASALQARGIIVDLFIIKPKGAIGYLKACQQLLEKINEFHPNVIHAHYGLSGITAVLQNRVPVVTTFHNGETHNPIVNFLSSLFSLRAKHVIYVAQHIKELVYFKNKNYDIIPCGIDVDDYSITPYHEARKQLGWYEDKKYILHGGAFSNERKNYVLLRNALKEMTHSEPLSVQEGEQFGNIVCVEMKGLHRAECVLRMCACDLFSLTTKSEGSPQTIKEALACGCPIVATDVADIQILLGDIQGHYLLRNPRKTKEKWKPDNSTQSELISILHKALTLPNGYRTNGKEQITALQLSNKQIAEQLIKIYSNVVKK